MALEVLDEYTDRDIFLIPIRLDDCKPHFKSLCALQYVDLFPDWEAGVSRIRQVLQTHKRAPNTISIQSEVRVTSHQARFRASERMFYFLIVTNMMSRSLEISHAWYEDASQHIPINIKSRPLPKRLEGSESWSTWIPVSILPEHSRYNAYEYFRIRLSTGEIIATVKEDSVPPYGSVPGGDILQEDIGYGEK